MSSLLYTYETAYFTQIDDLAVYQASTGKVHIYSRAIVELIFDAVQKRFYILCVDMASGGPARCFPAPEPIEDFEAMTGKEMPSLSRKIVQWMKDWA